MATLQVRINGRDYHIACDDGQEDQLRLLADDVDDRIRALSFQMGANPGEAMGLLLTALTMADELAENKREIDKISSEIRHFKALLTQERRLAQESRFTEMEHAMAITLEEIALRIEKIAQQVEMG